MNKHFDKIIDKTPLYKEIPRFSGIEEFEGIKAITYDGADFEGEKTKSFAYVGFPENASGKVPAVVLVHGGGGMPYMDWVKIWNKRGYAAIAMSTTGHFPSPEASRKEGHGLENTWVYGMYGEFTEEGYTDAPTYDRMGNSFEPLENQWMYHAVAKVILAHNVLRSFDCIDKEKIGITGISWGGVITSIVIGIDTRFGFAIPIYGSGYLRDSRGYQSRIFKSGKNPELWLAEKNFDKVKMPVLWLCDNKDAPHFSIHSNSKSYIDTVKNNDNTRLACIHKMFHSSPCGWIREESYAFADSVCKGTKRLPDFRNGEVYNSDGVEIKSVKIYYLTEPLIYVKGEEEHDYRMEQEWIIADFDGVPAEAADYYIEITSETNGQEYITTSPLVSVEN